MFSTPVELLSVTSVACSVVSSLNVVGNFTAAFVETLDTSVVTSVKDFEAGLLLVSVDFLVLRFVVEVFLGSVLSFLWVPNVEILLSVTAAYNC